MERGRFGRLTHALAGLPREPGPGPGRENRRRRSGGAAGRGVRRGRGGGARRPPPGPEQPQPRRPRWAGERAKRASAPARARPASGFAHRQRRLIRPGRGAAARSIGRYSRQAYYFM